MKSFLPILALCLALQAFASGYSFTPLFVTPKPNGGLQLFPAAISDDGSKVVGRVSELEYYGEYYDFAFNFLWERNIGATQLPEYSDGHYATGGINMSGDGSVIVIEHRTTQGARLNTFRWSSQLGYQNLVENEVMPNRIAIHDLSYDGQEMVGIGIGHLQARIKPLKVSSGKLDYFELSIDDIQVLLATCISSDGKTFAGRGSSQGENSEALLWNTDNKITRLGKLSGFKSSTAYALSPNGIYVTGSLENDLEEPFLYRDAFFWDETYGMIHIPMPNGYKSLEPSAVSNDGIVFGIAVISRGTVSSDQRTFLWDKIKGIRYLDDILSSKGVDLFGWSNLSVTDVTQDGKTLVGYGITPDNRSGVFIATLPSDCDDESAQGPRQIWGVALLPVGETSGWLNEWIGYIYYHPDFYPWSFCVGLGWLYTYGNCDGGAWFWSPVADWLYTAPELYPFLYSTKGGKWLYHQKNTEDLYDFATETTLRLQDL